MKQPKKGITALLLGLIMTASLLVSCSEGGAGETAGGENMFPLQGTYKTERVDLGLTAGEILLDIIEVDGLLRATIGVPDPNDYGNERDSLFYITERRWYGMDYVEDTGKREKTVARHEITFVSDPTVDFVFGGEHFDSVFGSGVQYHFYQNGEMLEEVIGKPFDVYEANQLSRCYGIPAHIMLYEDVPFVSMSQCDTSIKNPRMIYRSENGEELYVNDRFLDTEAWKPGDPYYTYRGLIGINGVPYALLEIDDKGRLVPLTPETTELTFEGTDIDGRPTGGAFSDGTYGYFMSNTELWQTNGTESRCIADLVPYGIGLTSIVRSVRSLSDGRILVSADGGLIELSLTDGSDEGMKIYDIGVINSYSAFDDLNLIVSKYNNQSETSFFRIKEYDKVSNLNLALLSGEIAMVITPDRFALNHYIKQGVLASLEEVAPELFEENVLIENVVDAARVDDTCYYLPVNFEIRGENITDPTLLENGKLFETRQEYYDFISKNDPEYFQKRTPEDIFKIFAEDLDEWINWENHTSHFDDGTFEALLKFCSQGSTQEEVDQYMSQQTAANQYAINWITGSFELTDSVESYRFTDMKKALAHRTEITEANVPESNPTTWVQLDFPMPSEVHNGFEIFAYNFYAVVDNEASRDAAGNLLQWLILEDVDEEYEEKSSDLFARDGFSINRAETDWYLSRLLDGYVDPEEEVAKLNEESKQIVAVVNGVRRIAQIHNSKCGQTQYDVTWRYIESADHFQYTKNEIYEVMLEEAKGYFAGTITAKQAAEYVQNRISLYLAEQG